MILFGLIAWAFIIAGALIPSYWIAAVILRPRQFPDDDAERQVTHGDPRLADIINATPLHGALNSSGRE